MRAPPSVGGLLVVALLSVGCNPPTVVQLTVEPTSLNFGSVVASSGTKSLDLRISNPSQVQVEIASVKVEGDAAFSVEDVPTSLLPGAAATLSVKYTAADGEKQSTGALKISSSANALADVSLVAATAAPKCDDKFKNGDETGQDCGGGTCGGCDTGQACNSKTDCLASLACISGLCTGCGSDADCSVGQHCKDQRCSGCTTAADCDAGESCQDGACTDCPVTSGGPIDTSRDPANCGSCGHACAAPLHAAAACKAGECTRKPCEDGFYDLDGNTTPGCEAQCRATQCTTPSGTVTLSDPPLPEAGLTFQGVVAGASVGGETQTSTRYTNVGTAGQHSPIGDPMLGNGWKNQGGFGTSLSR